VTPESAPEPTVPKDETKVSLDLALISSLGMVTLIGRAVILCVSMVSSKVMAVTTLFVASCTSFTGKLG
jgi:hypothetical protein